MRIQALTWKIRLAEALPQLVGWNESRDRMVDLQGGVVEAVPVVQERGDGLAALVAVMFVVDQQVGGQGREAGGDFPYVQVVDLQDAVDCMQVAVDGGDVGAAVPWTRPPATSGGSSSRWKAL